MANTFERRIFLLAPNYHGATLLSKLLNAHSEVVSLGDTYPSNRFDQICGCGAYVSQCAFWQNVKTRVCAQRYQQEPLILPRYPKILKGALDRYLYNTLMPGALRRLIPARGKSTFVADYNNFLRAVYDLQDHGAPKVFVDGVKSVSRVMALIASDESVDGVIHLTREPGDFAKSTMKQQGETLGVLSRSLLTWRAYHNRARKSQRYVPYLHVSYEALAENTDATLEKVFAFLGVSVLKVSDFQDELSATWHFMGNASLFRFDGHIRRSEHRLTRTEKFLVRGMTNKG